MASRPINPTQARAEAAIGGVVKQQQQQQKKNGGPANRKALGDIGNLVTVGGVIDGKLQTQISRPITRSFCAQLLANAQAAAAAENDKKQACVKVNPVPAPKAVQRKAPAAKAKPKEIIEISPDTAEEARAEAKKKIKQDQEQAVKVRKDGEGSSRRKKNQTSYTSVLTARSKAACGISRKPKEQILDIDAADADNELAVVEYVEDLYRFYKEAENENRPTDYMPLQPEITEKMRTILVDWLVEIHNRFELMPETLYLTVNIIDRFLSVKAVPRRELQLLGMGALLTASKYEEVWAPEVEEVVDMADQAYSNEQVLAMEKTVLGKLEWYLTVPTCYVFLVRFVKASAVADKKFENLVYFLAELGLMNYEMLSYSPSMAAASAVYAARCTLNVSPLWNGTLELHTGYSEAQIMNCAKLLVGFHSKAKDSKFQVVYMKYWSAEKEKVALLSPAKALLVDGSAKSSS